MRTLRLKRRLDLPDLDHRIKTVRRRVNRKKENSNSNRNKEARRLATNFKRSSTSSRDKRRTEVCTNSISSINQFILLAFIICLNFRNKHMGFWGFGEIGRAHV
jgi:hypothetical protein